MPKVRTKRVLLESNGRLWRAKWYDHAGRQQRKSLGRKDGVSRSQAEVLCDDMTKALVLCPAKRDAVTTRMDLSAWLLVYIGLRVNDAAEGTMDNIVATGRRLVYFFGSRKKIESITRFETNMWASRALDGLSENTRRKHVRVAKAMFNRAVAMDLLPFNPFDMLVGRELLQDAKPLFVTDAVVEGLLRVLEPTILMRPLVALCALAGLRYSEAILFTFDGLSPDHRSIYVANADHHITTKKKAREVRLGPTLKQILTNLACTSDILPLASSLKKSSMTMDPAQNLKEWLGGRKPGGVTTIGERPFQELRRWRDVSWRRDFPPHVVNAWMGHSEQVSARHYTAVTPADYAKTCDSALY